MSQVANQAIDYQTKQVSDFNPDHCHGLTRAQKQCSRKPNEEKSQNASTPQPLCGGHVKKFVKEPEKFVFAILGSSQSQPDLHAEHQQGSETVEVEGVSPHGAGYSHPGGEDLCHHLKANGTDPHDAGHMCSRKMKVGWYCTQHAKMESGGSSSSKKTKCTGTTKAGNPCKRNASGKHPETGEPVCFSHGAPKKSETKKSGGRSTGNSQTSGIATIPTLVAVCSFFKDHNEEDCDDCIPDEARCGNYDAMNWLLKFFELNSNRSPTAAEMMEHFANAAYCSDSETLFVDIHGVTLFSFIEAQMGRDIAMGFVNKLRSFANTAGSKSKELSDLWSILRTEFNIVETPQSSGTKGQPSQSTMSSNLQMNPERNRSAIVRNKIREHNRTKREAEDNADQNDNMEIEQEASESEDDQIDIGNLNLVG